MKSESGVKTLIIINIIIYIILYNININKLYLYNPLSQNFEFYQFFSHMFLHTNILHLFFNMLTLWMFGIQVEYIMGIKNLFKIYFLSGFIASIIQILFDIIAYLYIINYIPNPMIGSSGAISGILGSFAYLFPNQKIFILPIPFAININKALCIFIFISCISSFISNTTIAHFAHIGGILSGYFLTHLIFKKYI